MKQFARPLAMGVLRSENVFVTVIVVIVVFVVVVLSVIVVIVVVVVVIAVVIVLQLSLSLSTVLDDLLVILSWVALGHSRPDAFFLKPSLTHPRPIPDLSLLLVVKFRVSFR